MNASNYVILICVGFALIFFLASFLTKRKFLILTVILNLMFLGASYASVTALVGLPKPIGDISFFTYGNWGKEGAVKVLGGAFSDTNIYLILDEKPVKTYSFPKEPKLLAALKEALAKNEGWGFEFRLKHKEETNIFGLTPGDSEANIELADPQHNSYSSKDVPAENTQDYKVN